MLTYFGMAEDIKTAYLKSYNYEKMEKYNEAIKVLAPLYNKYSKTYTLNLRLGWLFFLNHNYKNAENSYKKSLYVNSSSIEAKLGLLKVFLQTENYQKAYILSSEIIKQDYYNYYGNYYAIKILLLEKKYKIAKINIEKILGLYPTDVLFLVELSKVYKQNKNPLLHKLYNDILILDPNNIYINRVYKK